MTGPIKKAAAEAGIEHNMAVANCGLPNGQATKINLGMCADGASMTLKTGGVLVCSELTSKYVCIYRPHGYACCAVFAVVCSDLS